MRSAYMVLGVPGDATTQEIEAAYNKAEGMFTRERLAQDDGALARLGELKAAYQVLRDPASRAAHDRKLAEPARPGVQPTRVIVRHEAPAGGSRVLTAVLWLIGLAIVTGAVVSWRNAEARKEQEIAARKEAEAAAARVRDEEERLAAQRASAAAQAEANEKQLMQEAQISAARANANMRAQEASATYARRQELYEQQRQESIRRNDEYRAAAEARARTERDKQRVRELCYQQYRRSDC